jgi:hypothetical protein
MVGRVIAPLRCALQRFPVYPALPARVKGPIPLPVRPTTRDGVVDGSIQKNAVETKTRFRGQSVKERSDGEPFPGAFTSFFLLRRGGWYPKPQELVRLVPPLYREVCYDKLQRRVLAHGIGRTETRAECMQNSSGG